jgi:hypothetical protein
MFSTTVELLWVELRLVDFLDVSKYLNDIGLKLLINCDIIFLGIHINNLH